MRIIPLILLLPCFLSLGGCYASYKVPTETVSREGTDSVPVKEETIPVKGLRILLVNRVDSVAERDDLTEPFVEIQSGSSQMHWGSGTLHETVKGDTRNWFYSQVASIKAGDGLREYADVLEIADAGVYPDERFDSLCRKNRIDLVIVNDGVMFSVNQDFYSHLSMPTTYHTSVISGNTDFSPNLPVGGGSYSSVVYYLSRWRLYWTDASSGAGFREQIIVQRGGYWNPKRRHPGGDVLSCALKAGEDFAALFR